MNVPEFGAENGRRRPLKAEIVRKSSAGEFVSQSNGKSMKERKENIGSSLKDNGNDIHSEDANHKKTVRGSFVKTLNSLVGSSRNKLSDGRKSMSDNFHRVRRRFSSSASGFGSVREKLGFQKPYLVLDQSSREGISSTQLDVSERVEEAEEVFEESQKLVDIPLN